MDPDQTAPWEQSDLGPCCLQYRLIKSICKQEEQTTKVVTGRLVASSSNYKVLVNK